MMKFGVQVNCYNTHWDAISTTIRTMEAGRWHSLWFADHHLPPGSPDESLTAHEGYTLIAVAAGMTERLRMGHLVLANTFRHPSLVAEMAATLDQASQGRFVLGIGSAWFAREHEAFGWDFPPMKERSDRLEEACELIHLMFNAEGPVSYNGRYYRLDNVPFSPRCYQKPHVPILIGGSGEKRTLRTLARFGDMLNLDAQSGFGITMEYYQHKVSVLQRHCEDVGRDPGEISHSLLLPLCLSENKETVQAFRKRNGKDALAGSRNFVIDTLGEFADAGVSETYFSHLRAGDVEQFQQVEEEIVAAFG